MILDGEMLLLQKKVATKGMMLFWYVKYVPYLIMEYIMI